MRRDEPRLQAAPHGPREGPVSEKLWRFDGEEGEGHRFLRLPMSLLDQVLGVLA